jgi:hypothetical protein
VAIARPIRDEAEAVGLADEVLDRLGAGGKGAVYRSRQLALTRVAAGKR